MSVIVTLHVFSGRPDPAWELTDDQAKELADRISRLNRTTLLKPPGILGVLGYRGFTVSAVREAAFEPETYIHAGIVDRSRFGVNLMSDDADLEQWLLSTAGAVVEPGVTDFVSQQLSSARVATFAVGPASPGILTVPPFNPGKWNNDSNIQLRNNCYNYANDLITNTFAQPGRGSGQSWTQLVACDVDVAPAAGRDGQVPTGPPTGTPASGHYVALVLHPGRDYHWYRQDNNTMWSHKAGRTAAQNTDNSGLPISDPRTCDRGPYTEFCGFFHCVPASVRIV